jgi:hypothetical protein
MAPLVLTLLAVVSAPPDRFLDRGFPAHDREWFPADYEKVAKVLSEPNAELPVLADATAARYFARICNTANLSSVRDATMPLQGRLSGFVTMQQAEAIILKIYVVRAQGQTGRKYHAELAHLMGLSLRLGAEGLVLASEFLPQIPKDGSYETRMAGFRQMQGGLVKTFQGAVTSLGETRYYDAVDLSLVLTAMAEVAPTYAAAFSASYKAELKKSLSDLKPSFTKAADQTAIATILSHVGG